jgi:hypothetical protein
MLATRHYRRLGGEELLLQARARERQADERAEIES